MSYDIILEPGTCLQGISRCGSCRNARWESRFVGNYCQVQISLLKITKCFRLGGLNRNDTILRIRFCWYGLVIFMNPCGLAHIINWTSRCNLKRGNRMQWYGEICLFEVAESVGL